MTSIAVVAASAVLHASSQPAQDATTFDALLARTKDYVEGYQKAFSFLVAEETYTQQVVSPWVQLNKKVKLTGEMFLTFLELDQEWVAVHDVKTVDGEPAPKRVDVRALLAESNARSVYRTVMTLNAQYNIGSVKRDFNEPTFGLLPFGARRSKTFSFEGGRIDPSNPAQAVITFKERGPASIIVGQNGEPVFMRGEALVDVATGRISRTAVQFDIGPVHAEHSTTYVHEPRLDMSVPAVFTERYSLTYRGRTENTACRAEFTNYQRFSVTGRIKK